MSIPVPIRSNVIQIAAIAPTLPRWLYQADSITLFPVGMWNKIANTNVFTAYQNAGMDPNDVDIGPCPNPGGPNLNDGGTLQNPGPPYRYRSYGGIMQGFSGGAYRPNGKWLMIAGAGHGVHSLGNRVIGVSLAKDVPIWESVAWGTPARLIEGTPVGCGGPGGTSWGSQPTYLDGRNAGAHYGSRNQFLVALDKYVDGGGLSAIPLDGSHPGNGNPVSHIQTFDWTKKGTPDSTTGWADTGVLNHVEINSVYDISCAYALRRGVDEYYMWWDGDFLVRLTFAPLSLVGIKHTEAFPAVTNVAACYDSFRDCLVQTNFTGQIGHQYDNALVQIGCAAPHTVTMKPISTVPPFPANAGVDHDRVIDKYFWSMQGNQVLQIDPNTGAASWYATSGTTPPGGGITLFNKWRYVEFSAPSLPLGSVGGFSLVDYDANNSSAPVYFLRTH